jgi:hypothetical protein
METKSLKALSMRILQGNQKRNSKETLSFPAGKPEGNFTRPAVFSDIEKKEPSEFLCLKKEGSSAFHGAVEIVMPEGDRVWIATEQEAVKLIPSGAVFFLGDEIMQLQKAGKEAARAALMIKQIFPGAGPVMIESII